MKTYEEMARDVLKRRDEELKKLEPILQTSENNAQPEVVLPASGRRGLFPRIAIPCAAAVTAAAVGLTVWRTAPYWGKVAETVAAESGTSSGSTFENKIVVLDGRPECLAKFGLFNGHCVGVEGETEFIPYSIDALNEIYGVEIDRLGRLHSDWLEITGRSGFTVTADFGSGSDISEREVLLARTDVDYYADSSSDSITVSVGVMFTDDSGEYYSPFSGNGAATADDDIISEINGNKALIWHDAGNEALIEMGGTLVYIQSGVLSEEEFIAVLDEYTDPANEPTAKQRFEKNTFSMAGEMPEFLSQSDVYINRRTVDPENETLEPYTLAELRELYGMEFDRFSRLHPDWEIVSPQNYGIYSREFEYETEDGETGVEPRTTNTNNYIIYRISETASIEVDVMMGHMDMQFGDVGDFKGFSRINGHEAVLYYLDNGYGAAIEINGSTAFIAAQGVGLKDFVQLLDEYTAEKKPYAEDVLTNEKQEHIVIHDEVPEFFAVENPFTTPNTPNLSEYDFKEMTLGQLNAHYGFNFNCLDELHKGWETSHGDLGVYLDGTNVVYDRNWLYYQMPNSAFVQVTAQSGTMPIESWNDGASHETTYSTINGYTAMLTANGFGEPTDKMIHPNNDTRYGAVIEMGDTLVHFKTAGLTEKEFLNILDDYTSQSKSGIIINDTMPESFQSPFASDNVDLDKCNFEPYPLIDVLGSFYGIEFDRLTRLHEDWEEHHGELGIYSMTVDNMYEIVTSRNRINYTLPNGAELFVEARRENLPSLPESLTEYSGMDKFYSTVNGHTALIYRGGEAFDDREYPNGNTCFGAVVDMGKSFVHIAAAGLTEEEFINVLREYTVEDDDWKDIYIYDAVPDEFNENNPFSKPDTPNLADCDFETYTLARLNDYYGFEFDRLGALHADWDMSSGDLGVYKRGGDIVWARNHISYYLPNGAFITLFAQYGDKLPTKMFATASDFVPVARYSTLNGCQAMLSSSGFAGDIYNAVEYPNGGTRYGAILEIGDALVHIQTAGLTREEFINILKEYTE